MAQLDLRHLDPVLALRHAAPVDDPSEVIRLITALEEDGDDATEGIVGFISEVGHAGAERLPTGEVVLFEGEIEIEYDGDLVDGWHRVGKPRLYLLDGGADAEVRADAARLFLAQSLRLGAARRFAGWRDRVVALVPEEVGAKESKIIRTTADGGIDWTHTYNVLDAYVTYASWVNELASEFGSTDEAIESGAIWRPSNRAEADVRGIIQAWLAREAADAQLTQARGTLKMGLGSHARRLKRSDEPAVSIADLARSLYTDRPNLSKVIKAAESDKYLTRLWDVIESDDSEAILAFYRNGS